MGKWADTRTRTITILIGAPIVFFIVYLGSPLFELAVLTTGTLATLELIHMTEKRHAIGFAVSISIMITALLSSMFQNYALLGALLIFLAILALIMQAARPQTNLRNYVMLVVGSVYIGLPLSFLIPIRMHSMGMAWVYMLFMSTWATDSLALVGGRVFGKNKLAPQISPGKTVEGALTGFIGGILFGMLVVVLAPLPFGWGLLMCTLIPVLTISGDLIESWIKRRLGIKDTGTLLPGHGGIIDRIDGLVMAIPVVHFLLTFFV